MAPVAPCRIVIAEPWSILRRGLIGVLHGVHTVVGHFDEVAELTTLLDHRDVDLAIIGDSAGADLISVVAKVSEAHGAVRIVVLLDRIDGELLRALLQDGAGAVLSKKVEDENLLDSVDRVLRGERVIDQRFLPLLFGSDDLDRTRAEDDEASLLTPRERDVLVQLARGASNRQIAAALLVGESTVKSHLVRIYTKLGVNGRHRAVGRAVELGLLT